MKSGSKTSLASTYDNVEAICKRILIFLSDTFDNINIFRETRQKSCKIQVIGQVILSIVVLTDYSRIFLRATDKHQCLNDVITISFKPNLIKYEK